MFYQAVLVTEVDKPSITIEKQQCTYLNQELYTRDIAQSVYALGQAVESLRNNLVEDNKKARDHAEALAKKTLMDNEKTREQAKKLMFERTKADFLLATQPEALKQHPETVYTVLEKIES